MNTNTTDIFKHHIDASRKEMKIHAGLSVQAEVLFPWHQENSPPVSLRPEVRHCLRLQDPSLFLIQHGGMVSSHFALAATLVHFTLQDYFSQMSRLLKPDVFIFAKQSHSSGITDGKTSPFFYGLWMERSAGQAHNETFVSLNEFERRIMEVEHD